MLLKLGTYAANWDNEETELGVAVLGLGFINLWGRWEWDVVTW